MTDPTDRPAVALCFGGGGGFGYGFNMGVADGMTERGLDLRPFPMVGTSAGAHASASIDTGLDFEQVADFWQELLEDVPWFRLGRGIDLAGPLYGGRSAIDVGAVAVRLLTLRRHVLGADEYALADIVAASSSVPVLVPPHRIDGKRYVDGGAISLASIDLAPNADLLLAITPFAAPQLGIAGRIGAFQARREVRRWSRRNGGSVLHVVPSDEIAELGSSRLRDIADIGIGRAVYPMAVEIGRHVADIVRRDHPGVVARIG